MAGFTYQLIFPIPLLGTQVHQIGRNFLLVSIDGVIAGVWAVDHGRMTHAAHGGVAIGGSHEDRLFAIRSAGHPVGRVAGGALHVPLFVQRKDSRNLHVIRRRQVGFVLRRLEGPGSGIRNTAVMTGKTHFSCSDYFFSGIIDEVRIPALDKERIYPAKMTDSAGFG